ncbi:carbohydrate-binding protein [Chitinophaga sp. 22321]|uniref:Carbohydrate-binding protein n=1 Tax=Chitinophaga hostae TaxID=2831022 RepID=A0ABS5J1U3_9BACT|nr:carbohydrate-binding protein [Chitinophaga hostae]MBS0029050.1 carbohydrate-binding protein [Chitinophaga hostae]
MKNTSTLLVLLLGMLLCSKLQAQYLLLDNMEGSGPCSGRWTYYAGNTTTGKVQFGVPNPSMTGLNTSPLVAKFIKDTTCFEYMTAGCSLPDSFDLSTNSIFKMLVYASTKDEIMFKLQPGDNYSKAVYFTYKVSQINQWEEATFNFQSVKNRTDFNKIEVHYIDGRKANGILYFDLVQGPNPTGIILKDTSILMGQENGAVLTATLRGSVFDTVLTTAGWTASNLPSGVSIGNVQRVNDTIARITLSGNSPANYSRAVLKLSVSGQELVNANTTSYNARGNVVFEGNPNWTIIFNDEFNTDGVPDVTKWKVDPQPKGWINGEQQVYTDTTHDNARIKNGNLVIKGKKDFPNGNTTEPWSSARLITQGRTDFLYGKVEVRAKLPRARGSWPAIWLMPTSSAYGAWPKSGELDVMEHVGNNFGTVLSTVHTQNHNWTNGGQVSASKKLMDADTAFHVYGMEWSADSIAFIYDSVHVLTYKNPHTDWKDWPFDQKFFLILNVAIGGGMGGAIADADWPDSMTVDYVRISQKGLGTPILDSVTVTPATLSFLPGKTQQYTAKAVDQNGRVMNVTPVWSITGAGNSITAGGLATLNDTAKITATLTAGGITKTAVAIANVRAAHYKPIPAKIEAENFDNGNACCTESTADTGGGLDVSYIGTGTWFEYDIAVPDSNEYRIQFRVAANSLSSVNILLDNVTLQTVNLPASGGWQNWSTVTSLPIRLGPGQKTIRIQANKDGWNFNWLRFLRADSIPLARLTVKPDTAVMNTGTAKQFTVSGIGQDSSVFMVQPVWAVSGTGNSISANGLFTANVTGNYFITATEGGVADTAIAQVTAVPVLTRIVVTPDTVAVPVGASQQFKATGYDQRDSIFAFTPVWTTTGTGNIISTTGVFTAGNTPGSYVVSASRDTVSGGAVVNTGYSCSVNGKYEAESASNRATGPYLETCTDIGGGQNFINLHVNDWFAYSTLNVPVAGRYTISFRVSTTAAAKIWIGHSGYNFGTIDIPSTGGVWQTISDTITLPALSYTGVHVQSGAFKYNWFSISNCAVAPPGDSSAARMAYSAAAKLPEANHINRVTIYPNPTTGQLVLELKDPVYNRLTLLDLHGNVVKQWRINKGQTRISQDIGTVTAGTYILKLENEHSVATFKVIKL